MFTLTLCMDKGDVPRLLNYSKVILVKVIKLNKKRFFSKLKVLYKISGEERDVKIIVESLLNYDKRKKSS